MVKKEIIRGKQNIIFPLIKFYGGKSKYKILAIKANFVNLNLTDKKYVNLKYDKETKELFFYFTKEKKINSYRIGKNLTTKTISANMIMQQIDLDVIGKSFKLQYEEANTLVANLNEAL